MKKILIIGTGGTIASGKSASGLTPLLTPKDLLKYIEDVNFCEISEKQLFNIDSTNMTPEHWVMLAEEIKDNYKEYDGFVICHGTDTMSYTASALSYLIQNNLKPIVLTGSQKPISVESTDAKMNLHDSILFASDDKAYGVNIVFDGNVIAATRSKKERTKSYNAFSSINFPPIAIIQDKKIVFYIDDKDKIKEKVVFYNELNSKILLYKLIPGANSKILEYLSDKYDCLVMEAFGVGGVPVYDNLNLNFKKALECWNNKGKPIVIVSQVAREGSDMSIYEVGRNVKEQLDILESYDMTLEATLTKLMWILSLTNEMEEIKKLFYKTINHDILFANK